MLFFENKAVAGALKHAFCAPLEPSCDGGLRAGNAMPLRVQLHATQVSHVHGWISQFGSSGTIGNFCCVELVGCLPFPSPIDLSSGWKALQVQ